MTKDRLAALVAVRIFNWPFDFDENKADSHTHVMYEFSTSDLSVVLDLWCSKKISILIGQEPSRFGLIGSIKSVLLVSSDFSAWRCVPIFNQIEVLQMKNSKLIRF